MQIAWREVVDVVLLEDPTKEVDGLVQRVDCVERIQVGPEGIEHLVARACHLGLGQEEAEKGQHLTSDGGSGD